MSKYSDHSTIGGQVLAHRIRMIRQNANIIWIAGRIGFVLFFFGYLFTKCGLGYTWNYLCCLKASFRVALRFLPNNFLDSSYFFMEKGWWKYVSDYTLTRDVSLINFKNEFDDLLIYNLKISGIFAVFVMIAVGIIHKRFGKKLTDKKDLISGHNYVTGKELKKLIKDKSDITLSGIPYPKGSEARHTLITGTTGSGKTNVIIELIDQVQALGERAIIVDTVGTYVEQYYNPERGDIILNPLDPRSVPWSFLEECDCDTLLRNVASCLIDKGGDHDRFWEEAAKIVFVETAKKIKKDKKSIDEFIDVLLKTPLDEMQKYLSGSYGASLMDKSADKMALSIRATLINAVHIFDVLREDSDNNFSIKKWINESAGGFLFLSCSPKERSTIIPMITAWLTIASESLMETKARDKRTWFFIDELHNLRKLPMLDTALAEIRKFGGCFVMGTQLISQLNVRYGHELTRAITGLCGTKVVMNVPEPITAKYMADFLGDKEEITTTETLSYGANTIRDGANIAQRYSKESTVSGSQIMNLTTGEAFIRFYGIPIVGKVMFKFHENKRYMHTNRKLKMDLSDIRNINIFGQNIKDIEAIFESLRKKNAHVIVIDENFELCKKFAQNVDILIDIPNKRYSWDIASEFNDARMSFIKTILDKVQFNDEEKRAIELFFIKKFTQIDSCSNKLSTNELLNILIFEATGLKPYLKEQLTSKLHHLKILINDARKITIKRYINGSGNCFIFMPCFGDINLLKIANMLTEFARDKNVYIISNIPPEARDY